MEYSRRPSQKTMFSFLLTTPRAALFADMGYGKSVVAATLIDTLLMLGESGKTLIIAPIRVRDGVWPLEFNQWDHLSNVRVSIVAGGYKERRVALLKEADVYIINYENIPWLIRIAKRWPFDTVVVDESSKLKDPSGSWFKTLASICGKAKRWINLTGTPATSGLHNLWSQIFLLDQGKRLGASFKAFQYRFYDHVGGGDCSSSWVLKPYAEKQIYALIADICLSMYDCEDVKVPEFNSSNLEFSFSKKLRNKYNELERDMFIELEKVKRFSLVNNLVYEEEETDTPVNVNAMNAAVLTGKCRQFCNGAMYYKEGKWVDIHDEKIKMLQDVIEESYGEPLLIGYQFKPDLEKLKVKFPKAVTLSGNKTPTADIVKAWEAGDIPQLLMYPGSDAHGLNLQHGGRFAVWFGPTWSLDARLQFNKRLARPGAKKPGVIWTLIAADTIEQDMLKRQASNQTVLECLMSAMKRRKA